MRVVRATPSRRPEWSRAARFPLFRRVRGVAAGAWRPLVTSEPNIESIIKGFMTRSCLCSGLCAPYSRYRRPPVIPHRLSLGSPRPIRAILRRSERTGVLVEYLPASPMKPASDWLSVALRASWRGMSRWLCAPRLGGAFGQLGACAVTLDSGRF